MGEKADGIKRSVVVTDKHLASWNITSGLVTRENLRMAAMANMANSATFISIGDMLFRMTGMEPDCDAEIPMYILTNKEQYNGAVMVCDKDTMDSVAEEIGRNFYILPSSIHEVIIVPNSDEELASDTLRSLVSEVNSTQVAAEDRLSDNVYRYDYTEHVLKAA